MVCYRATKRSLILACSKEPELIVVASHKYTPPDVDAGLVAHAVCAKPMYAVKQGRNALFMHTTRRGQQQASREI